MAQIASCNKDQNLTEEESKSTAMIYGEMDHKRAQKKRLHLVGRVGGDGCGEGGSSWGLRWSTRRGTPVGCGRARAPERCTPGRGASPTRRGAPGRGGGSPRCRRGRSPTIMQQATSGTSSSSTSWFISRACIKRDGKRMNRLITISINVLIIDT